MKKILGYFWEYTWMFVLLGFLWHKGDGENREEDLARLYKAKDQVEINNKKDENKLNNKSSDYNRDSEKAFI